MSWLQLYDIIEDAKAEYEFERSQPPQACPNDGTPLVSGPPSQPGILFCPNGDFQYPRDWDPETMTGM